MTADRQGGEAAEEIEAVCRAMFPAFIRYDKEHRRHAGEVIAALDAVRSSGSAAQNQEEMGVTGVQRVYAALARSPQGEDHEAGRCAAAVALAERWPRLGILSRAIVYRHPTHRQIADVALDGFLSRCPSPERDTRAETVAEIVAWIESKGYHVLAGLIEREFGPAGAQEPQEEKR